MAIPTYLESQVTPKTTQPSFIVLGMAPGRVEDSRGVPFVGQAGTLLRNELRRSNIDPNLAYYMNVVCCFPPNNKVPPSSVDACRNNLKDQWDSTENAEWVLVCGNLAMETLIPHADPIHTRHNEIRIHGKRLWCIYHPSHILRASERQVYVDWQNSLAVFNMILMGYTFGHSHCIYCGSEEGFYEHIPVCNDGKCMKKWKIDSKWRYSPPVQERLL